MGAWFRNRLIIRLLVITAFAILIPTVRPALAHHPRAAGGPTPGGSITIRQTSQPDCLDDYKSALLQVEQIDSNVHIGLTSPSRKQTPTPGVAQKWKISNGGKKITFFLRKDVRFSDGKLLTSADVKASFAHAMDPATKSPVSKAFLAQVTNVTTPDKYTVVLTLSSPSRVLLTELGSPYLGILEKSQLDKVGQDTCGGNMLGTGPFKYGTVAAGFSSVTLTQNKDYHNYNWNWANNKGKPYLTSIHYVPVPNDATAISELLTGSVDISGVPGPELNRVQGNKNIVLHKSLAQSEFLIIFNTAHPPFNNPSVRKAVAEVIDKNAIIKASFNGLAKPATSILPSSIPFYDPASKSYDPKLNPSAATAAISAANAKGPYTLLTFNVPTTATMAEIVQSELGTAGMNVNIQEKSVGDWVQQMSHGDWDISMFDYVNNDADILYFLFNSSQCCGKGLAFTNYTNSKLDQLTARGRADLTTKKARADYYAAQKIIGQNVIAAPIAIPINVVGVRSRVKGWHTDIGGTALINDLYIGK
jgi:peptide/nickel transport system substrate-binding protein